MIGFRSETRPTLRSRNSNPAPSKVAFKNLLTIKGILMSRSGDWRDDLAAHVRTLQRELNRLFDTERPDGSRFSTSSGRTGAATESDASTWAPGVDLIETDDSFVVFVDLPGVDAKAIELSVTGRIITLRGGKEIALTSSNPTHIHMRERASGPFFRQLSLPGDVELDAVEAELRDGVLRVRIAKGESARPRTIPIQMA